MAKAAMEGAGSGASALVTGYGREIAEAEGRIALWKGSEGAVLLPSGYQAAHAAIQTLAGVAKFHPAGVRFLADKLCHASLIDAVTGSGVEYRVFPHNQFEKLERLLGEAPEGQVQVVVTESIFSMDGDAGELRGLVELKKKHPFVLVVDEAHGSGVYGEGGAGYAAEVGVRDAVDVSIMTLSKAVGVSGGAVCGSSSFCDAVVNWGRAYIYSTAVPPAVAAGIAESIRVMKEEPERQKRVREIARWARGALKEMGVVIPAGDSPIIPVIYGSEASAVRASERLREKGLLVVAIRPPTVARGTSRLRVTLSCEHSDSEVERLIEGIAEERNRVERG